MWARDHSMKTNLILKRSMLIIVVLILTCSFLALAVPFAHAANPTLIIYPDQNSPGNPHGTTNPAAGTYTNFTYDSLVDIFETPNTGYIFNYWNVDGFDWHNEGAYTDIEFYLLNNPTEVHPLFIVNTTNPALEVYTVPSNGGIMSPLAGTYTNYTLGSTVTISETPNSGYSFTNWFINHSMIIEPNPFSFQITGNTFIGAAYIATTFLSHTFNPAPLSESSLGTIILGQQWQDNFSQNQAYVYNGVFSINNTQSGISGTFEVGASGTSSTSLVFSDWTAANTSASNIGSGAVSNGFFSFTIPAAVGITTLYQVIVIQVTLTSPEYTMFNENYLVTWVYSPSPSPTSTIIGTNTEYLFLTLFLCLGLGIVGFGMTKGKEPLASIFMIEFGVFIGYAIGWAPAWLLAASIGVLAVMLAYRFRGALMHG
jgi:hypothetical protein